MSNTIYCTYLTVYSGNKLPPFYIGSTSVDKINKGYHGSVSSKKYKQIWYSELKNNPNLFRTHIITTHSTREEAIEMEYKFQRKLNVVKSKLYINQSLANVRGYHGRSVSGENNPFFGREHSIESKRKISESNRGINNHMFGKNLSEQTKKTISDRTKIDIKNYHIPSFGFLGKKHSESVKEKLSEINLGKKHSEASKQKMSLKRWFFNPETGITIKCLPDDRQENFIPGRKNKNNWYPE